MQPSFILESGKQAVEQHVVVAGAIKPISLGVKDMSIFRKCAIAALLTWAVVLVGGTTAGAAMDAPLKQAAPAGHYVLDKSHSTITFKLNHLGFSFYTALFSHFDATLDVDPVHLEKAKLAATIEVTSLTLPTPPAGFREELLGPNWLNAGAFPVMNFRSTQITPGGKDTARVVGDFTLNGKTVPVTLDVTFNGGYPGLAGLDPHARIGYSAHGNLRRSDFGIVRGIPAVGSTMGVSDQVEFMIEVEFNGPPVEVPASP